MPEPHTNAALTPAGTSALTDDNRQAIRELVKAAWFINPATDIIGAAIDATATLLADHMKRRVAESDNLANDLRRRLNLVSDQLNAVLNAAHEQEEPSKALLDAYAAAHEVLDEQMEADRA